MEGTDDRENTHPVAETEGSLWIRGVRRQDKVSHDEVTEHSRSPFYVPYPSRSGRHGHDTLRLAADHKHETPSSRSLHGNRLFSTESF